MQTEDGKDRSLGKDNIWCCITTLQLTVTKMLIAELKKRADEENINFVLEVTQ